MFMLASIGPLMIIHIETLAIACDADGQGF